MSMKTENQSSEILELLKIDDKNYYVTEISSLLPVRSTEELDNLESKLKDGEFVKIFETYVRSISQNSSFEDIFRSLATDEVFHYFNLDGRNGKRSLKTLILFKKVFRNILPLGMNNVNFENKIRKQVKLAHNRLSKAKHMQKKKSLREEYINIPETECAFPTEHVNLSENIVNEHENGGNLHHQILEQLNIIQQKQDEIMNEINSLKQDVNSIKLQQNATKKNSKISLKPVEELTHAEVIEINSLLPVNSMEELDSLENRLENPEFMKKIEIFVKSMTEDSSFSDIFRSLAADHVLFDFNLDGRHGKRPLKSLNLYGKVFQNIHLLTTNKNDFERKIRKEICRAHNRIAKSKIRQKWNNAI